MRTVRNYIVDPAPQSTFLSCEKDTETILRRLFVESKPYSDELKRLLLINTKDCLDDRTNQTYKDKIAKTSISDMVEGEYIRLKPNLKLKENEEVKSYIHVSFDNFIPNMTNPYYRDHIVEIDIICHIEAWDLGNFRVRPLKIAGYIDAILNDSKLAGIGKIDFIGCNEMIISDHLAGYSLMYRSVNADDDHIPAEDE